MASRDSYYTLALGGAGVALIATGIIGGAASRQPISRYSTQTL